MSASIIKFKGIVDKERNPFSTPSWSKEHSAGGELGTGKPMQATSIENFQKVLDKGGRLKNIRDLHREKYATFQGIRWGYAIVQGDTVVPNEKWYEISPKSGFKQTGRREIIKLENSKIQRPKRIDQPVRRNSKGIDSEQTLIEQLRTYNINTAVSAYLENGNLKQKTPDQILRNFTFGNSISRAFHYESPTIQFDKWASTIDSNQIVQQVREVRGQSEYDQILFNIASSLSKSWKTTNENGLPSKMNIGIALKINNLLMKHLVYTNMIDRKDLISYLHVPLDKFTLLPLKDIWQGNPRINSSNASQGFVKTKNQYIELHKFISRLTQKANVNRINYEFWAWDNEH